MSFVWGGDVCGQGWGVNPEFGGLKIYEAMRLIMPDLFIHSGDAIYADGVIPAEIKLDDGSIWKNLTTPEKSKVAETLDEFRGNYRYNLMDENLRRFNSEVPTLAQWDDHETRNNWYPGQILEDERYAVKSVDLLSARARRAFLDYADPLQRRRSGANLSRLQLRPVARRHHARRAQLSRPQYAEPPDGCGRRNGLSGRLANGVGQTTLARVEGQVESDRERHAYRGCGQRRPGQFRSLRERRRPALGREIELAELLRFIKRNKIKNVVWITTDVHYCAAHYYDPARAQFTDFDPFWEFVAGPLNAGAFKPGEMDDTFGPQVKFAGTRKT